MGVVVNSSHVVSAAPSSSVGGLLTLCHCSSVGSLPQEAVLHGLLQCESFSQAAVLQKLLQRGSLLWGAVLQEQTAPVWASHQATAFFRHPPAPTWGPPWAAGGYLLHHGPPWAAGVTICLTVVFSTGCRGISAPVPGAPPPPSSSLTLVSAELFLSHILTPFFDCSCCVAQ